MIDDAVLHHVRRLMTEFEAAVGTTDGLQQVSAEIYASVGIRSGDDYLVANQSDPHLAWHWLASMAEACAAREDLLLTGRIFGFVGFWNVSVAPLLGPADWMNLCLPAAPPDVTARVAAAALPCLVRLPPKQIVTGNATGLFTADAMAAFAAQTIVESPQTLAPELVALAHGVLAPAPVESPLAPAVRQLDRVKQTVSELGLTYVDLGEAFIGVGIALGFGPADWVVVSVAGGGLENAVAVTAGILKDVAQDRPILLELCNTLTRDNPIYPVFLHDAQEGWDVLVQQRFDLELVLANPAFLRNTLVNLPVYARQKRDELAHAGVRGEVHEWDDTTIRRVFVRSMM